MLNSINFRLEFLISLNEKFDTIIIDEESQAILMLIGYFLYLYMFDIPLY